MSEALKADQAQEQSVEDQIASKFIDINQEPEAPQEPEAVETEEVEAALESDDVEVEYNGERFKIPKQLEKAIMQERDYTRKSQEIAEQKRIVEHEKQAARAVKMEQDFMQSISAEAGQINALDSYLRHLESVDVRTLGMDDQIAHLAELNRVPRQREQIQRSIEAKRQKFMQEAEEQINKLRQSAKEVLAKNIPNFSDEVLGAIRGYAKVAGFTEQEADFITTDPKSSSVLWKAMRFDELQKGKAEAVKKASPSVKPGASNPMPSAVKDKLNLRKSIKSAANSQDKAKLIEQWLAR